MQSFPWLSRCCGCRQPPGLPSPTEPNVGTAYLYAALIFVFPLVGAMALVHSNRLAIQVQIKLRAELTSAVYRKALRLSARCGDAALMCLSSSCSMCCGIYSVESTAAAVQDADLARFSHLQGQAADRDWAHCQSDVGGCQQCHGAVFRHHALFTYRGSTFCQCNPSMPAEAFFPSDRSILSVLRSNSSTP